MTTYGNLHLAHNVHYTLLSPFHSGGEHMVKVNGEPLDIAGCSLADYLISSGYDLKKIAVERNDNIVPKVKYNETILQENDVIEVVRFVGGG